MAEMTAKSALMARQPSHAIKLLCLQNKNGKQDFRSPAVPSFGSFDPGTDDNDCFDGLSLLESWTTSSEPLRQPLNSQSVEIAYLSHARLSDAKSVQNSQ